MLVVIFIRVSFYFHEGEVIKMCNVKNFLAAMLLVFAVTIFGSAEAAIVTDKVPLQCYVDHKVTSYDTGSGQAVGWIDAEVDLVRITGIDGNGVAIGTHPGRNGTVERLFWARDVFADTNYSNRNVHVNGSHQVYRTQNSSATIGSISNEDVTVVADNGNRAQIIYRLDNGTGYKMGWVPSSVVPPPGPDPNPSDITVNLNVPYYLQGDSRWAGIMIGTRNIKERGCLLTALAMKYSFHTNTNTTPDIMKNKLSFGGSNGNDLYWNSVSNLGYTYTESYGTNINNSMMSLIYRELKNGKPVIIGAKGNEGQHWVVITGYKGNSNTSFNSSDFIMNDPSHRDRKTLNQFIAGHQTMLRIIY